MIVNPSGSMYVEHEKNLAQEKRSDSSGSKPSFLHDLPNYKKSLVELGQHQAVSMGFYFLADKLYGLPEREDTLQLKNTAVDSPYELWAADVPGHPAHNPQALYGSVPYITSVNEEWSTGLAWVNSAHSYFSISNSPQSVESDLGRYVSVVSEAGAMEFFMLGSKGTKDFNHVKST